jgi:site-specific recombinase
MIEGKILISLERYETLLKHENILQDVLILLFEGTRINYWNDRLEIEKDEKLLDYIKLKYEDIYKQKFELLKKENEEKEKAENKE